ncbi:DUF4747 family protein [uncultured Bacteroides sp.]|uniref:DUF4747 family protein n=1 Tax=uncultured Bacteroides sp. TaxID=162156 RepID=UPI002AAAC9AE|nr:DUF4747 family protein [uncultured Bacteroides sp.]
MENKKRKGKIKTEKLVGGRMFVLNIKSRQVQKPSRYVELLNTLKEKDPLIKLQGNKYISLESLVSTEILEEPEVPKIMMGKLSTYDILDPEAFYNRRKKELVEITLDPDVVANVRKMDFSFFPKFHRLVFRTNAEITSNQVEKYFSEAFLSTEGEDMVDVYIVKSSDIIERILKATKIFSLQADVTFSNKDFSDGFTELFDKKIRESDASKVAMNMISSKDQSLNVTEDGLVEAIVKVSQSNGTIKASILEGEAKRPVKIDTAQYPMIIECKSRQNTFLGELYSKINSIFGGN